MYLLLEKMDSMSNGVKMTAMVFITAERANAYRDDKIKSYVDDFARDGLKEGDDYNITTGNDTICVDVEGDFWFAIQIQKVSEDFCPSSGILAELSDSNGWF